MKVQLHFSGNGMWLTVQPESEAERKLLDAFSGCGGQFVAETEFKPRSLTWSYHNELPPALYITLRPAPVPPLTMPADGVL